MVKRALNQSDAHDRKLSVSVPTSRVCDYKLTFPLNSRIKVGLDYDGNFRPNWTESLQKDTKYKNNSLSLIKKRRQCFLIKDN